jgi:hypothetical protein
MPATPTARDAERRHWTTEGEIRVNVNDSTDSAFVRALVRVGVLVLPLGAVLKLVGNLGTFDSVGYGVPQATEAATVTTPAFFVGELVGSVVPVLLTPFGVFALFAYLLPFGYRRTLTAGLVCTVLGAGVTLAALGVVNYAIPALGHAYRDGDARAMDIADSFFTWPRGAMIYPAVLVPVGAVLFAVAMWRTRALPRWATALFAFSTLLVAVPVPLHAVRLAGGAIGLAAGICVAWVVRRDPAGRPAAHPAPARY